MTDQQTPEFNHIQHNAPEYTEEILWHRVYAVGGAFVLVLTLLAWGLYAIFSSTGSSDESFRVETFAPSASIPQTEMGSEVEINAETKQSNVKHEEAAAIQVEKDTSITTLLENSNDSPPIVTKPEAVTNSAQEAAAAPAAAVPPVVEPADYPVAISIQNQDITHAALTDRMNGLEPARELSSTANLDEGFLKLYFYTDLSGRAGDILTYSWYRNDKRIARIRVPVGSDRWRSHASKNISANMRGDWKVVVTDRKGNTLATSTFSLKAGA